MSDKKNGSAFRSFAGMLKLGAILAIYSAVCCIGLAFVYTGTADIIAERQRADLEAALLDLFPQANSFEAIFDITSPDPLVTIEEGGVFAALRDGEVIGAALRTSRFSYSGPIVCLVGVGVDNRISGVKILENIDTPGLGSLAGASNFFVDRANGITFYGQFAGKGVNDPFMVKQDIIIITASTITSRAVADSVKAAGMAASAWFDEGGSR
ncbi:MAG: FMN-binding protein [Treponema sp.]|nr:FMN-binding protein [Treponema sp.]